MRELSSNSWKKFLNNWQKMTSPGRPTFQEINIYKELGQSFLKKTGTRVLLLGSTPELRDMLSKYKNISLTIIDINLEMIEVMSQLMKDKTASLKETWVKASWLNAPLPSHYFDLIYGDFVLSNVDFKYKNIFLKNIKNWLKPSGCFITRNENFCECHRPLSIIEFEAIFQGRPLNQKTINLFWEVGVWSLGKISGSQRVSPGLFYKRIKKYLVGHNSSCLNKILQKGGVLYPLKAVWYVYKGEDSEKLLKKYFKISDSRFDDKINFIYPDVAPIYKLKPKV
jgi:SAM-dependent methyltransferase